MPRQIKEIRQDIREHKQDMKANGFKVLSFLCRHPSLASAKANERLFALKVELQDAQVARERHDIAIDVRPHQACAVNFPVWQVVVTTTKGLSFAASWAGDRPSDEQIRQAWREDRKSFDPHYS
jgi:hypothetical protein